MILSTFGDANHVNAVCDWLDNLAKGNKVELTLANNPGGFVPLLNKTHDCVKNALLRGVEIKVIFHGDIASCAAVFFSLILNLVNDDDGNGNKTYPKLSISLLNPVNFLFHTPRLDFSQRLFKTNYPQTQAVVNAEMQKLYNVYYPMFESAFEDFMLWYNSSMHKLDMKKRFELYENNVDVKFLITGDDS